MKKNLENNFKKEILNSFKKIKLKNIKNVYVTSDLSSAGRIKLVKKKNWI